MQILEMGAHGASGVTYPIKYLTTYNGFLWPAVQLTCLYPQSDQLLCSGRLDGITLEPEPFSVRLPYPCAPFPLLDRSDGVSSSSTIDLSGPGNRERRLS